MPNHRIAMKHAVLCAAMLASGAAFAHASPEVCSGELSALILPPLERSSMKKQDIQLGIADESDGVYSVRLSLPAKGADNPDDQVTIGWVNLDTRAMKALDMTRDPDHPDLLAVDQAKYRKFVSDCLREAPGVTQRCDALDEQASQASTRLPPTQGRMIVVGNGRLPFHSAPDDSCRMPGVFILSGESVQADRTYRGFTSVVYLSARKNGPVKGWVRSDRLKAADSEPTAR